MKRILIINGSHRSGNTDIATQKVKKFLEETDFEVKELFLRNIEMKLPDGCEVCAEGGICPNIKDDFSTKIEPTLRDFDIYIVATPTWSDNVTPLLKIFWDRIVSWCGEDRMYLKDKKLYLITHGMAGEESWSHVISWIKSVCKWEECEFVGVLSFKSGGEIGSLELGNRMIQNFVFKILKW